MLVMARPIQRGPLCIDGVRRVAMYMAHSKSMRVGKMNQRVLWRIPRERSYSFTHFTTFGFQGLIL